MIRFIAGTQFANVCIAHSNLMVFTQLLRDLVSFAGFFFDLVSIKPHILLGRYNTKGMIKAAFAWICGDENPKDNDER